MSEEDRALAKQRRRVLSLFFFGCEEKSVYSIIIHRSVSSLSLSFCEEKRRAESDARGEEEEEEEEELDAKTTEEKRWRERCGC